jgi:hypothetical protein
VETVEVAQRFRTLRAPSDLQPHYGNWVFGNVYLLAIDNTVNSRFKKDFGSGQKVS